MRPRRERAAIPAALREVRGFLTFVWVPLRWFFGGLAAGLADALVIARLKFYPSFGRVRWRGRVGVAAVGAIDVVILLAQFVHR